MAKTLKRGASLFVSVFLAWQSIALLPALHDVRPGGWAATLFLAWVVNMMVTGFFAFAGFALPTQELLPDAYYRIGRPDRLKAVHRALGVEHFRRFLLATFFRARRTREGYFDGSASGLDHLDTQSRKSEFGHVGAFVVLTIVGVDLVLGGAPLLGAATLAFNVLGNLYPALLQRHHRMRIQRIEARAGGEA